VITLEDAAALAEPEQGLAVASTCRADGTIQSSVVNAGVLAGSSSGNGVLAFVAIGRVKLANLRSRPEIAVTFRHSHRWATVEGRASLIGPDDGAVEPSQLRQLLREIFVAAGGTHDNWDEYDLVMAREGRTAVLITPTRIYGDL
jgi:PPOX class probable F420-dependent enzyme